MNDAQRLRELREQRKAAGLCPHCGVSVEGTGFAYCATFRQEACDRRFRWRGNNLAKVRKADRLYKRKTKAKDNARCKARYNRLKAAGLCVKCGLTPVKRLLHCLDCRQIKRDERLARAA